MTQATSKAAFKTRRLPKELKKMRAECRLVFGRGHYEEAHEHADRCYAFRLEERRNRLRIVPRRNP